MKTIHQLAITIAISVFSNAALAYTQTVNGITWTYSLSNNEATIGRDSSSDPAIPTTTTGAVTIPATLGNCPVTTIKGYAFCNCRKVTSITIPDSVKSVGRGAFAGCSSLRSITIPDNVETIAQYAFDDCPDEIFDVVSIPSVKLVDGWVIECDNTLSGSLDLTACRGIADRAFYNCSGLTSITMPANLKAVGEYAFANCSGLTAITIPDSVKSIGWHAFHGCSGLTSIIIPDHVTVLNESAFSDCSGATELTIGNRLTTVERFAFTRCSNLERVTIPSHWNVTDLLLSGHSYGEAVWESEKLSTVIVKDGADSIPSSMFSECAWLKDVSIPASVTNIESKAFADCTALDTVRISDLAAWCGIAFGSFDANPLYFAKHFYVNGTEVKDLVVPDGVVTIRKYAFRGFSGLLSVTLPDSVKSVGGAVFRGCANLASADLGKGLKTLGGTSFADCPSLAAVSVPNTVTTVDTSAFSGCTAIATATFPGRLSPQTLFPDSWSGIRTAAFANGTEWVTNSVFEGCTSLTDITVPGSVTNMGSKAFKGCTNLDTVRTDDLKAWCLRFYQSADATPLYYAEHFFVNGNEVRDLVVPDGTKTIRRYAFRGFSGLQSVTLPDSMESIGGGIFKGCMNLGSAKLGTGLKMIGGNAFSDCTSLTTLVVPPKVTTIDSNAFNGATGLETMYLPRRFEGQTDPMSIVPTCTIYFYGDIEALSVPEVWLDRYELAAGGDNIAAAEAIAANGVNKVWECYVAGLDPTNALSRFEARIAMEEGDPVVTWSPDLRPDRVYAVFGATEPGAKESAWADVTTMPHLGQTDFRFFKVKVSLKEE